MNDDDLTLQEIATAPYLAALCAGDDVYFYWGDDKEHIWDRVAAVSIVMIGANLDTEVFWLKPEAFPELYGRLRKDVGHDTRFHFVGEG